MSSYLRNNIFSISLGTSLSKLVGFFRQIAIAAAFGVGIAYDAFNYAYIIPGFILIIIGGINGPLHNAVVTVLTPIDVKKASSVLTIVGIKLSGFLLIISLIVFFNSDSVIDALGPNLNWETKVIASHQLKILSPCIPLSGIIGLSFGALNSKGKFLLSSLSPAITSIVVIFFILLLFLNNNGDFKSYSFLENELLAIATLIGTLLQFVVLIIELSKNKLLRININTFSLEKEEKRIFKLIIPACLSSGLGQINIFVDMFFASSFRGAASGLAYANFLIQAPLGILSNTLILPLLPIFSQLRSKKENRKLEKKLASGVEYCFLTTFFLTGIFISFNKEIVEFVFQRGAFNLDAALSVRNILKAYAVGIPFYLYRDLLIRAYYSIEKTKLPFKLSLAGIILNVLFDWILIGGPIRDIGNIFSFNLGIIGIVLSSGVVNLITCIVLSLKLDDQNIYLPKKLLLKKIILISLTCLITSIISSRILQSITRNNLFVNNFSSLLLGFIIFTIFYFFISKLFKVNKLKLNIKSI